jgi:DNA repair exonuclease SbcCD nuclease subunit
MSHRSAHNRTMRFLHTADWQIGMAAAHAGEAASRIRQARVDSARRVLEAAREHSVEFIILAGDTFEHNGLSRAAVAEIVRLLAAAHCPIFLIPGNHDPLQPGSVWDHPAWAAATNVNILREPRPITLAGGMLFPCPIMRKRSDHDPTAWIPNETGGGIRVGIAHGNTGDLISEGGYPIAFDAATRAGLDYLALGHWHSTTLFTSLGAVHMAYSGTHETTRFGELDSGNALLVDIPKPGSAPVVTKLRTGTLVWEQISETITEQGKLADISRSLNAIPDASNRLVEVNISGLLFERECEELDRIRHASAQFLYARIQDVGLRPAPDDDDWIRILPAGVIREAAERLRGLASTAGEQGAVATQALRELYAIHSEVRP